MKFYIIKMSFPFLVVIIGKLCNYCPKNEDVAGVVSSAIPSGSSKDTFDSEPVIHFGKSKRVLTAEDVHSTLVSVGFLQPQNGQIGGGNEPFREEIANGVETLGGYALAYQRVSSVIIPESVTKIKKESFIRCRNLENIFIPRM